MTRVTPGQREHLTDEKELRRNPSRPESGYLAAPWVRFRSIDTLLNSGASRETQKWATALQVKRRERQCGPPFGSGVLTNVYQGGLHGSSPILPVPLQDVFAKARLPVSAFCCGKVHTPPEELLPKPGLLSRLLE
jgi:hypothetical protein